MTRIAVVTGAAGGIGSATALAFHRDGWRVVAIDRAPERKIEGIDLYLQADVSDPAHVADVFRRLAEDGEIHALVNNAAIQIIGSLAETTPDNWDAVMASNLRSAYLTTRAAVTAMSAAGGAIVNVSSVHAIATSTGNAAYAASKGALAALTRAAALELAPAAIRVNAVLPGAVDTAMLRANLEQAGEAKSRVRASLLASRTPLGRFGRPDEIAQAILFLADPERSSFITGQMLIVDGGATAKLSTE